VAKVKRLLSVRQHQTRSAVTQKIRQFWALLAITAAQIWLHLIGMVWLPEARPTVSQQWRQGSIAIHTHPFNGPLSGTIRSAGTRKVKPIWILLKQESEWQWHQLGHMQVCNSFHTDNHASTPPLNFLQAGCPSCHPTNSVKALKAKKIYCYNSFIIFTTFHK